MASNRIVLFIGNNSFYLSGYVNSKSYIRGYVENGDYNLYIVKQELACWIAYHATAKNQCTESHQIGLPFDGASVTHVVIPETMRADHNTIINWARSQKRKKTWLTR